MTDTPVTSAPSVIVAALRRITHFHGNPLDDSIWGRSARFGPRFGPGIDENTFNGWVAGRDSWAIAQLAEAHALDVLHDAYKLNESAEPTNFLFTHADPFAHIDAMIHEEFPGAIPDAKLGKLRTLAQERLDLKSEIESYKRALQEPITNGHDPRIRDLIVKAAETANAHDYCEAYDVIAGEVGLWNRRELGLQKETYIFSITGTGTAQEMRQALRDAHPTFTVSFY